MVSVEVEKVEHKFLKFVVGSVVLTAVYYFLMFSFLSLLDLPEVRQNVVTKECVAVVIAPGVAKPCEGNIPSRYDLVNVAPGITYDQVVASLSR